MVAFFMSVVGALRAALRSRVSLVAENLALRQQLAILRRQTKRARLTPLGSGVLDRALARLVAIGAKPRDRQARDRDSVASAGIRSLLGLEVEAPRPTADQAGDH